MSVKLAVFGAVTINVHGVHVSTAHIQHHTKLIEKVCCSGVLSAQFALSGFAPGSLLRIIRYKRCPVPCCPGYRCGSWICELHPVPVGYVQYVPQPNVRCTVKHAKPTVVLVLCCTTSGQDSTPTKRIVYVKQCVRSHGSPPPPTLSLSLSPLQVWVCITYYMCQQREGKVQSMSGKNVQKALTTSGLLRFGGTPFTEKSR